MEYYLSFQTIILCIAFGFMLYGEYQSNEYIVTRKRNLYVGIGHAILVVFALDLFTVIVIKYIIQNAQ